LTHVRVYLE